MKISVKNLESITVQLSVDGAVSSLAPGESLDVDLSESILVKPDQTMVGRRSVYAALAADTLQNAMQADLEANRK